ncbi:MAG: hypothetical protein KIT48_03315 [Pseudolabrys sp.]|nr:hypothetical protein [Pseudolabrys sp.]
MPIAAQLALSGCAQGGMGDALPHALGGLPDGAPKPPAKDYKYPNVYDTPTPRANAPLDDQGQLDLQKDLQNLRDQQGKLSADPELPPPQAPAAAPAKKKPAAPKTGQATGAKTNP